MRPLSDLVIEMAALGLQRSDAPWRAAMRAEYAVARADGAGLSFAVGCLVASAVRLTTSREGRAWLSLHAAVLLLVVPLAAFHLGCAATGVMRMAGATDPYYVHLLQQGGEMTALAGRYRDSLPVVTLLLVLLGSVHLLIAWAILDRRWVAARLLWLAAACVVATLLAVILSIGSTPMGAALQCIALMAEAALLLAARGGDFHDNSTRKETS